MRTTNPSALQQISPCYDQSLMQFLQHIITGDGAGFGHLQQRIATLPMKDGGLGVYTMADTSHFCYLASCMQTKNLQDTILKLPSDSNPIPGF